MASLSYKFYLSKSQFGRAESDGIPENFPVQAAVKTLLSVISLLFFWKWTFSDFSFDTLGCLVFWLVHSKCKISCYIIIRFFFQKPTMPNLILQMKFSETFSKSGNVEDPKLFLNVQRYYFVRLMVCLCFWNCLSECLWSFLLNISFKLFHTDRWSGYPKKVRQHFKK